MPRPLPGGYRSILGTFQMANFVRRSTGRTLNKVSHLKKGGYSTTPPGLSSLLKFAALTGFRHSHRARCLKHISTADAHVSEALLAQIVWVVDIAAIEDEWLAQASAYAGVVWALENLPGGDHDEGIRAS